MFTGTYTNYPIRTKVAMCFFTLVVGLLFFNKAHAASVNYTVCTSGCDFTTLADALLDPGLDGDAFVDTVTLTSSYVFDNTAETAGGTTLTVPAGVTIACDPGADTFGDAADAEIDVYTGSDFTLQNCSTENVHFDSSNATNINFLNNTFSSTTDSWLALTSVDGYEINGNTGIQRLQLQGADNGVIENNSIECRFSSCVNVVANGTPDFSDPPGDPLDDHICNHVLFNNNTITNYATGSLGDWVIITAGKDIRFTNNTIKSAVTMNDEYLTLVTVQNAQAEFTGNYIITPTKVGGATNGTWAFNIRVDQYDVDALYEHNTVIGQNVSTAAGGDACIGVFDGGGNPNVPVTVTANYNLCYQSATPAAGTGINLNYNIGSANVTLNDSYNGFYGFGYLFNDSTGTITGLNTNTVTSNPLLRTENVDTSDDYYPSPISRYLDVNGSEDIGAYSGARVNDYLIDDSCVVDYATCFSNTLDVLPDAVSTGDSVHIGAGTYDAATLSDAPGGANNVTVSGAGATTIIHSSGAEDALTIDGINNSTIQDLAVENATNATSVYTITKALWVYGGNTYDQSLPVTGTADAALYMLDNSCTAAIFNTDGQDITTAIGGATDDVNAALVDTSGNKITIYIQSDFLTSDGYTVDSSGVNDYLTNKCGAPNTIDQFIPGIFTANGNGTYSYNPTAVSLASASLKPGETDPPSLDHATTVFSSGIKIKDSNNNTIQNILSSGNAVGVMFTGSSAGNSINESTLTSNAGYDVDSDSSGDNDLKNTLFNRTLSSITGTGIVRVWFKARAFIKNALNAPLNGASAVFKDALGTAASALVTAGTGYTLYSDYLQAFNLTSASLAETNGGYNPYSLFGSAAGYQNSSTTANLNTPNQTVTLTLPTSSGGGGGGGGGGSGGGSGGGGAQFGSPSCSGTSCSTGSNTPPTSITPGQTTPTPSCGRSTVSNVPFKDISNHWARAYIENLYRRCIIDGRTSDMFVPDGMSTRAELVKIALNTYQLGTSLFEDSFLDVKSADWFAGYVIRAAKLGIVEGYINADKSSNFKPHQSITRAEALKVILKAKAIQDFSGYEADFGDVDLGDWYYDYVAYAEAKNIVDGYTMTFDKAGAVSKFYSFPRLLGVSDQGKDVSNIKTIMAQLGYYQGEINTSYDAELESAISAYQRAKAIKNTGQMDYATRRQILKENLKPITYKYFRPNSPITRAEIAKLAVLIQK